LVDPIGEAKELARDLNDRKLPGGAEKYITACTVKAAKHYVWSVPVK
jgi:hypothetical protein